MAGSSRFGSSSFGTFRFGGSLPTRTLAGTQAQVGTQTRQVSHVLPGTQAQVGSILFVPSTFTFISISGTQAQSGSLNKANIRNIPLAGTQGQGFESLNSYFGAFGFGTRRFGSKILGSQVRLVVYRLSSGTQAQAGTRTFGILRGVALSTTQAQSNSFRRVITKAIAAFQRQLPTLVVDHRSTLISTTLAVYNAVETLLLERDAWETSLIETGQLTSAIVEAIPDDAVTVLPENITTTIAETNTIISSLLERDSWNLTFMDNSITTLMGISGLITTSLIEVDQPVASSIIETGQITAVLNE